MFEHGSMVGTLSLHPSTLTRRAQLHALRQKIHAMQSPILDHPVYPLTPSLSPLLPDGGLRRGSSYQISRHHSLLWLSIAHATTQGHYVAIIGVSHLGFHSAVELGVDLKRVVIVDPGRHWWSATSALADAVSLLVVSPGGVTPPISQRERLQARLRERGSTLLCQGTWPGSDGSIEVVRSSWKGLGHGDGYLSEHILDLSYQGRRDGTRRQLSVLISGHGLRLVPEAELSTLRPRPSSPVQGVRERYAG